MIIKNIRHIYRQPYRLTAYVTMIIVGIIMGALSLTHHADALQNPVSQQQTRPEAIVLTLNGAVTPTAADYLSREINAASKAGKELIILEIDTPGGLVTSMESIIKSMLSSTTPVVTYVSPQGAKSASAGLYIMYAAHISAMAPATNTGSATPIQIGGGSGEGPRPIPDNTPTDEKTDDGESGSTPNAQDAIEQAKKIGSSPLSNNDALRSKIINNSVAYIQKLAELRGRNSEWAEKAVRDAANITASQALELNVIDLIADDMNDLLTQINGRTLTFNNETRTLNTQNILLTRVEPTFAEKILGFFADPNVAAILMSLGMLGITVEFWNPGSIIPGAVGFICLGLGLYAAQTLPFNWLGVWLIIGGICLIIIELYTPTFGVAGIIGLTTFAAGLYLLFPETLRVSNSVIATTVGLTGALLALVFFAVVKSRAGGPMLGSDAIRRREGIVDDWDGLEGYVIVEGERWQARSAVPLEPGDKIKVSDMDGLILVVRKATGNAGKFLDRMRPDVMTDH